MESAGYLEDADSSADAGCHGSSAYANRHLQMNIYKRGTRNTTYWGVKGVVKVVYTSIRQRISIQANKATRQPSQTISANHSSAAGATQQLRDYYRGFWCLPVTGSNLLLSEFGMAHTNSSTPLLHSQLQLPLSKMSAVDHSSLRFCIPNVSLAPLASVECRSHPQRWTRPTND